MTWVLMVKPYRRLDERRALEIVWCDEARVATSRGREVTSRSVAKMEKM